jgi:ribosomal 50S subunit-associated protein YjgA (DUF615 family)
MIGYDSTQLLDKIGALPEPFRSVLQSSLDAMSEVERERALQSIGRLLVAFEAGDKEDFRAACSNAGYGDAADFVWQQLETLRELA